MKKGLCTAAEMEKCEADVGAYLEENCQLCPKKKNEDINPYTFKLVRVFNLKKAGYPFRKNDLTLEEWFDLAVVSEYLNPMQCPFMGEGKPE